MAYPDRPIDFLEEALDHCLTCGTDSPAGARFCRRCGRAMAGLLASEPSGTPRAEHKQVTVLFADVQGSMVLSERLDPEEWYRILVRFFVLLADGVQRVGGVVNRFTGDGIMALFGAPLAQEDHAQRACYAALQLRQALEEYATELRETRGVELAVRIGISSGDVVAATLGRDGPTNYTALGPTVHLASAMERLAEPGRIFVSERTASHVEGFFRLLDRGVLRDRRRSQSYRAFELAGPGAFATRFDRARWQGLLRFVGRSNEMRILEHGLDDARAGLGAIIGVRGEVGVGKSRLCQEFVALCAAEGVAVYDWRILSHLSSTPYLNLVLELRRWFAIQAEDSNETVRLRIAERLRALGGTAAELAPFLERLLGVAAENRAGADPGDAERVKLLIGGFVAALGARRPAVVLVEDLHWIDSGSAGLLALMLESIAGTRVLMVLNFRPEYRAPRLPCYREVSLAPLGPRATNELLRQLLGDAPALEDLAAEIRERTRGNPFFMEELVTMLATTGVLVGRRGAYAAGPKRDLAALPSSLQALLESRIDLLPPLQKEVLQTAAVIGKTFSLALLRRVSGLPDLRLDLAIAGLQEADFIAACEPSDDEAQRTFRHPLMQEQAYNMQVKEDRAADHAALARACIEIYADRLDERASLVAYHWEHAGDYLQAASWGYRAAAWIGHRNLSEGLLRWRAVCTLLERAPASSQVDELGVKARAKMLELGGRLGMAAEESARIFAEGHALAARATSTRNLALLYRSYGQARGFVGAVDEALELTREASRLADESGEAGLVLRVRVALTYALMSAGRLFEAMDLCERLLSQVTRPPLAGTTHLVAYVYSIHAALAASMGRPTEARADLTRAADAAWRWGDAELLAQIYAHDTIVTRRLGEGPGDCLIKAQRAVEIADYLGNPFGRVFAYWSLGNAHLIAGDGRTASKILHGVLLLARDHGVGLYAEGGILAELACARLARGDGAVALSIAEEAVRVARRRGTFRYECSAQLARAFVLVETSGVAAAAEIDACLDRVLEIVALDGSISFAPVAHFYRGRLAELKGDETRALVEMQTAAALLSAMGATGWVERIERRMRREAAA